MGKKIKRLMAYVYMPLTFVVIGYFLMYVAFFPFLEIGFSLSHMVIAQSEPEFESQLSSIFEGEKAADTNEIHKIDSSQNIEENTSQETVSLADVVIPEYETHYGLITCDRLQLRADLYYGDSNEVLRYGVGQYPGSLLPGFGGTTLVAAHNTMHFLPLKDAVNGDIITVQTNYGTYEYEVTDIQILRHDDPSAVDLGQKIHETLVLYTCYPFEEIVGVKQDRYFVYADKISGPDVVGE